MTERNKEINKTLEEIREAKVYELVTIMNARKLLIEQLGRPDLPDDLRELCLEHLPKRKLYMSSQEEDLISVEDLLGRHESVLQYADSACKELDGKIDIFDEAVKQSGQPGLCMNGIDAFGVVVFNVC